MTRKLKKSQLGLNAETAFNWGYDDHRKGVPLKKCPYASEVLSLQWQSGWHHRAEHIRQDRLKMSQCKTSGIDALLDFLSSVPNKST